jgi:hypothetical protein
MPRVVHFEISADKPERAVKFYSQVFDWKIEKWGPQAYWLAITGPKGEPGIDGAIQPRTDFKAPVINTIDVPNFEDFKAKIIKAGGKAVTEKTTIPGIGYFAYFLDTEGNPFGIMQSDPKAK